jgi:6-pyruvoyltetrahydropterin/6-carboxytetrahydropterin synthase
VYRVFIKAHFSSAHYLRNYPGECEHLHGHNWEVEVHVEADALNEIDVAIDFRDLKKMVSKIVKELDHKNLNEHPNFRDRNPSSERLAEYIFRKLKEELVPFPSVKPHSVKVCETPSTGVIYSEQA